MSKRRYNSQSAESAPEDLVKHLKAAANDEVLLREIIENSDIVSITAAFAALLSGGTSDAVNDAKHRKKTRNRPCRSAPNETLVEILLFADRDTLDSMQLVCHFMLNFIRDREAGELPLRSFSEVNIGKFRRPQFASNQWKDYCLPFGVLTVSETGKELFSDAVSELVPYLRLAYCVEINVDIRWTCSEPDERRGAGYGLLRSIFDDLVVPNTFVNVVTVYVDEQSAIFALRSVQKFCDVHTEREKVTDQRHTASQGDGG
ncbi:hypothetical protein AAVH_19215 [Aphelenchoides avenae]|nr:hypothetical protein AAVH_19215 [Aphelenchus avenae]